MVVAALRQRRIGRLRPEDEKSPGKTGRFLFYGRLNWSFSPIKISRQRLATSLGSASYREIGDNRTELRGSPEGVPGGRAAVARLRDRRRHSHRPRQYAGGFSVRVTLYGNANRKIANRAPRCCLTQLPPMRQASTKHENRPANPGGFSRGRKSNWACRRRCPSTPSRR
jgi:hypothetical protein